MAVQPARTRAAASSMWALTPWRTTPTKIAPMLRDMMRISTQRRERRAQRIRHAVKPLHPLRINCRHDFTASSLPPLHALCDLFHADEQESAPRQGRTACLCGDRVLVFIQHLPLDYLPTPSNLCIGLPEWSCTVRRQSGLAFAQQGMEIAPLRRYSWNMKKTKLPGMLTKSCATITRAMRRPWRVNSATWRTQHRSATNAGMIEGTIRHGIRPMLCPPCRGIHPQRPSH